MPNDDQQRLEALKRFFVLDHTECEDEVTRLVRVAAQVYGVAYAALTLREGEDERVAAAYGFDPAALPPDAVFCERTVGPSIPVTVPDASEDARFAKNPLVHGPQAARFYAGVPLKGADGFTLGTLALLDPTSQELNGEGMAMLVDLGALVEPTLSLQQARAAQAEAARQHEAAEAALLQARQALEAAEAHRAALEAEAEAARAERDALTADYDTLTAAYEAVTAERDATRAERDALVAERETLIAARDALAAERDATEDARAAVAAEHEAALQALDHYHHLAAAAAEAAARLAADPAALRGALARLAPEAGATRAVLVVKTAAGPSVRTAWHAEGFVPLAEAGDLLDADELDAWADARGVEHLAALPLPGGLVLLDAAAWAPEAEPLYRAAFAPLGVALRRRAADADGPGRNRLLAGVSHEIRTVLTTILGHAEALGNETGPGARPMVERIHGSSARLLRTLDTVLDLSRLEASGGLAALTPVDVGAAVEAAAAPFRPPAEARDLAFFAAGTDLGAYAWADAGALGRTLTHLLTNAFAFTDQGGVRLRVYAEDDWVGIEVQDTGAGIDPERLPHLFDALEREEGTHAPGAGLGLTLTKRLVDLMGGEISVTSLKGQGSVFRIVLQSAPAPASLVVATGDGDVARVGV